MTLKYYRCGRISMIEMPVSWSPAMMAWLMGEAPLHRGSKLPWTFNTPLIGKMHFHPDTTEIHWVLEPWILEHFLDLKHSNKALKYLGRFFHRFWGFRHNRISEALSLGEQSSSSKFPFHGGNLEMSLSLEEKF